MLASATEIEVELNVPEGVATFFGVTWAQDRLKDKVLTAYHVSPKGWPAYRPMLNSVSTVIVWL